MAPSAADAIDPHFLRDVVEFLSADNGQLVRMVNEVNDRMVMWLFRQFSCSSGVELCRVLAKAVA